MTKKHIDMENFEKIIMEIDGECYLICQKELPKDKEKTKIARAE